MLLPGRLRILYAASHPAHAKPAQLRLQHEGHLVDVAPAGKQGLSLWDTGHYDALALGLDVHDNSGFELVQALASRGPLPPTIMIADSDNETIAQEAMKLGADE
jgi:DNA-binding response OmpR family regulator